MRRSHGLASLLVVLPVVACSSESTDAGTEAPTPTILADNLTIFTADQAAQAVVTANQVSLPAAGNERLLKLVPGSVVVSDRGGALTATTNPYGFLRHVQSVTQEGAGIVITTTAAQLGNAITSGGGKQTLTPDYSRLGSGGPAPHPQTGSGPADPVDQVVFTIPSRKVQVPINGKVVEISLGASLALTTAKIDFKPTFDIGMQLSGATLTEFHAIANGAFDGKLVGHVDGTVGWDKTLTATEPADEVTKLVTEALDGSPWEVNQLLFSASVPLPAFFVGPVPVVTDLDFQVEATCKLGLETKVSLEVGAEAQSMVSAGVKFENGQWSPVSSQTFSASLVGPNVTAEGSAKLECSLKPTLMLRFYGFAGPYLYVEPYAELGGKLASKCEPPSTVPVCDASADFSLGVRGGVGAKIDVDILGVGVHKDLGELQLFDAPLFTKPLFDATLGDCPFGYCSASGAGGAGGAGGSGTSGSGTGASSGKGGSGTGAGGSGTSGSGTGGSGASSGSGSGGTSGLPICATGLSCVATPIGGATACAQTAGGTAVYCCPAGQSDLGGTCKKPYPTCGTGLSCAATAIGGATACVQTAGGATPIYCCPSGEQDLGGTCGYPTCGSGLSCYATAITGATACVQTAGGTTPIYCCPSGQMNASGVCQ